MNTRRPSDAAGESWRKWGADRPPADALRVDQVVESEAYWIGRHDGIVSQPIWRRIILVAGIALAIAFAAGFVVGTAWVAHG